MKAVCYARTSTLDQAREEKVSIPDQINWAKTFALERGWEWVEEYIEPGVTGDTEIEDRKALNKLVEDAKQNKFDIVLVYHSSRLAREPDIGMRVCRILGQLRKQVYFRNAPIEPVPVDKFSWGNNIGSQYMTAFSFIGDFQENVARSERVRSGFQGLAKRGKLVFAPFGYKKIPKIITDQYGKQRYDWLFEIDPKKALIVKRIFDDYLNKSGSIRSIMLSLNKGLIPSPAGTVSNEAWSPATVKNILSNPAYIGKIRWGRKLGGKYLQGKSTSGKQKRSFTKPDKWILTDGQQPKIIEEDIYNKVQEKLKLRYILRGRAIASSGLLTGLVYCGRCNRKAYFKSSVYKREKNKNIRHNYVCQTYFRSKTCQRHIMSANKLHEIIIAEIGKVASNITYRKDLLNQNKKQNNSGLNQQKELYIKSIETNNKSQERILRAYESGTLSLEEFGKAKGRLDNESLRFHDELEKINKTLTDTFVAKESMNKFLLMLKDFKKNFGKVDFQKQKNFMQYLISSIIVKNSRVKINFRI
jgi:site-specific DNA recombinase